MSPPDSGSPTERPLSEESSPNKRLKSSNSQDVSNCGICFTEEGNSARGYIDSCEHFFCFVCILEWSKVESRCPLCKRRFSSIRRPPKLGIFSSERVVNVPVRDQAYHPLGNITVTQSDPYAQVKCSVCQGSEDEYHLLLCDLCDSGAHSYCVGLGTTIPEGDWFCRDCTLSRADHEKSEEDTVNNEDLCTKLKIVPRKEVNVSVIDDERQSNIPRLQGVAEETTESGTSIEVDISIFNIVGGSNVPCIRRISTRGVSDLEEPRGSRLQTVADKPTETGARTLRRCRNVHRQVRILRESWNALRRGSLSFPSRTVDSGGRSGQTHKDNLTKRFAQQEIPSSATTQQLMVQGGSSSKALHNRSQYDIDKAWKMMEAAKSVQKIHGGKSINRQVSGHAPLIRTPTVTSDFNLNSVKWKSKGIGTSYVERKPELEKHSKHKFLGNDNGKHNSSKFAKEDHDKIGAHGSIKILGSSPTAQSEGNFGCRKVCHGDKLAHRPYNNGARANIVDLKHKSACMTSPVEPALGVSDFSHVNQVPDFSSSCERSPHLEDGGIDYSKSKSKIDEGPKSEIQALVKLNLKLLSKNRHLGSDVFKEVARHATHSILAACGLEHPKPGVRSFPSSICCHSEHIQQLQKSILMPGSCRECFYVFVQDVVYSILSEKEKSFLNLSRLPSLTNA